MTPTSPERESSKKDSGHDTSVAAVVDEETTSPEFGEAPDGGVRAWLVVAGAASIYFSTLGYANSFGVFQEYYMTHQLRGQSPDRISWIGSLAVFLHLSMGAIAGPLFDRFGAWVIRPAAVLYVIAIMMTSLCKEYWQFMLAQAVLLGTAMGFLIFPATASVSQYFEKKRAAALGVTVAGSSVGGIIFPMAFSKMLNGSSLGFGTSVRIIGFVMILLLAISCVTVKARLPPRRTTLFIGGALKDPKFICITLAMLFMFMAIFTPLFFIPTYAVSRGMDATLASYLLAIVNAASVFGRVIPGILADKFGRLNVFAAGGISTGIVILCFNLAESTAALVVYSIAIGFTSGTVISGGSVAFTMCTENPQDFGSYLGMGIGISSIAALLGPPVNGVMVDKYGGFSEVSVFSGVMCLFGGFLALASKATTAQGILGRT
ncbi:hypothetical protein FQN50_001413 [Emmonsiellopsis sp. PD_5]|nr:hypothetical protein FQN50_001413 [Emmonsiellopsis sp. PD_5]